MNSKITLLLSNLNEQISFIDLEIDDTIHKCEKAIEIILISNNALKKIIIKNNFKSEQKEILFFKEIKPHFTSKLIYFNRIYKIEMQRPNGGNRVLKKYYQNELLKLKAFFDNELEFYKYFLRGVFDIKMSLDSYYFETDRNFFTSHDFKVAKILAKDLIQLYLENQLIMIDNKDTSEKSQRKPNIKIAWTGTKVALVELIYALHARGTKQRKPQSKRNSEKP